LERTNINPLITVVIPCYNAMPFLPAALESIINQSYSNLEILCINDGSTDETGEVLDQYAQKDSRINVVHNETNLRLIATLNKAVELASGDYIARMDADDISDINRIKILLNELLVHGADVVSCNYNFLNEAGTEIGKNFIKCISYQEVIFASYFFTPIGHALIVGKKEVFVNNPYSLENYAVHSEDYELWTRLIRQNRKLINVPDILYAIRINSQSVSRKYEAIQNENFVSIAQNHIELFLKKKIKRKIIQIVVNRMDVVAKNELKEAFALIHELHSKFSLEFPDVQSKEIVTFQKTDILLQVFKKGTLYLKFWSVSQLFLIGINSLFSRRFWQFIRSK